MSNLWFEKFLDWLMQREEYTNENGTHWTDMTGRSGWTPSKLWWEKEVPKWEDFRRRVFGKT